MAAQPISFSYLVTNRVNPSAKDCQYICPLPSGQNSYFFAKGANNANQAQYHPVDEKAFLGTLGEDIQRAIANGGPQVTLVIHGLGYLFSDACTLLGTFGKNLVAQGYKGLLIEFDWPSYDDFESWAYYGRLPYSFPPQNDNATIRDNINGSVKSLAHLLYQILRPCKQYGARLNIVCHSEGNYMLMLALHALVANPDAEFSHLPLVDQVLMLAGDINNGALQTPNGWAGQGSWIAKYADAVTIYWSSQDDVLPSSEGWTAYHNPSFPKRLGLHGPNTTAAGTFLRNAYSLDCSLVVNASNPYRPPWITVHASYFYIPQVLLDMRQTLEDTPPSRVVNRSSTGNQSFRMNKVPAPLKSPFEPQGAICPCQNMPVDT